MLPEADPAPGSRCFRLYQLTAASCLVLEWRERLFPVAPYRGAEPRMMLCFRSCCKIKEGNGVLGGGEELQIPGRLAERGSCPWHRGLGGGVGPGPCWEQARRRDPRRGQTPEHPSIAEHPEPTRLCPRSLHGWIRPEQGGTYYVFADISALSFSWALGGYWEDTGCRWEWLQGGAKAPAPAASSRAAAAFAFVQ